VLAILEAADGSLHLALWYFWRHGQIYAEVGGWGKPVADHLV
jgi:hypothetical protein